MNCNILLLGQTGVGKSALLNYLAGEELAESGISANKGGITRGINKYQVTINSQICNIFDSEGFELKFAKEWKELINKELFSGNRSQSLSSWYHIVILCIGANSARIQDFELNLIDKIVDNKYGIIIALTKSDLATENELNDLKEAILNHFDNRFSLTIIPVCSKKRRNNYLEGKEEISSAIITSWGKTLINRLPRYIYSPIYDSLLDWLKLTREWLSHQKISLLNKGDDTKELIDEINGRISKMIGHINSNLKSRQDEAFREILDINKSIGKMLDFKNLKRIYSSLSSRFVEFESFTLHKENTSFNIAAGSELSGGVALFFPIAGLFTAAINLLINSNKDIKKEMDVALINQYRNTVRLFYDKEKMLEYVIADIFGYYYGKRETAICYLKGRGVEKDERLFASKITEVEKILDNNLNLKDGLGEYYIAYHYFSRKDFWGRRKKKGMLWLNKAIKHRYEKAYLVSNSNRIFAKMKEIEEVENKTYENNWYKDNCWHIL